MKKLAKLATISLFAASSIYAADSLEDAFKNGTTSGELSVYHISQDNKTGDDAGFTVGSIYLNYSTDELSGFKATVGARANHLFNEKENNDYWGTDEDTGETLKKVKAVVTEANISYATDMVTVIAGRQAIDLEWIGDYHDAVVGVLGLDKLTVIAGYTNRIMVADPDGALSEMTKFNGNKGAYVLDASYAITDEVSAGLYYMNARQLFNAKGGFVSVGVAGLETTLKYAQTSEKVADVENGKIYALDLGYEIEDVVTLNGGYIKTDKDGGIGTIAALGDNISPFEDGNQVYGTNAKTWYLGASSEVAGFGFGALYGQTKYKNTDNDKTEKEKELNLFVDKEVYTNLTASAIYVDVKPEDRDARYDYISLQLAYSF
jgi:hypothetical protein